MTKFVFFPFVITLSLVYTFAMIRKENVHICDFIRHTSIKQKCVIVNTILSQQGYHIPPYQIMIIT